MRYVSHHAAANRPSSDGTTQRAHWEASARRGNPDALARLEGPRFPDALAYLHEWFVELSAARGEGVHGPAAITYQDIDAWARLMDRQPEPHEVAALTELDRAYRNGWRADTAAPDPETTSSRTTEAWPAKKQVAHG